MPVALLERGATFAFEDLASDRYLQGHSRDRLVERLAHHYDQVNHVHPFREGNGRTQRLMWDQILTTAGWDLDWRPIAGHVNDRASRAAQDGDLVPLRTMFDTALRPLTGSQAAGRAFRVAQLGFGDREPGGPDPHHAQVVDSASARRRRTSGRHRGRDDLGR